MKDGKFFLYIKHVTSALPLEPWLLLYCLVLLQILWNKSQQQKPQWVVFLIPWNWVSQSSSAACLLCVNPERHPRIQKGNAVSSLATENHHIALVYVSLPAPSGSSICCQGLPLYIHQMKTCSSSSFKGKIQISEKVSRSSNTMSERRSNWIKWKPIPMYCIGVLHCLVEAPVYVFPSFFSLSSQTRGLSSLCRQFISSALQSCSA